MAVITKDALTFASSFNIIKERDVKHDVPILFLPYVPLLPYNPLKTDKPLHLLRGDYCDEKSEPKISDKNKTALAIIRKHYLNNLSIDDFIKVEDKIKNRANSILRRYEGSDKCGSSGHFNYKILSPTTFAIPFIPHSCGSIYCPYCRKVESRDFTAQYRNPIKELQENRKKLTFITLTTKRQSALDFLLTGLDKAFKDLRNLYQTLINFNTFDKLFKEALQDYNTTDTDKINRQIRYYEAFKNEYKHLENKHFGQVFKALVKMEVVLHADNTVYAHWHLITDLRIPQILLSKLWQKITKDSNIVHIEPVKKSRGAIDYLSKYESKQAVSYKETVSLETKFLIEAALFGRQTHRAWGLEPEPPEDQPVPKEAIIEIKTKNEKYLFDTINPILEFKYNQIEFIDRELKRLLHDKNEFTEQENKHIFDLADRKNRLMHQKLYNNVHSLWNIKDKIILQKSLSSLIDDKEAYDTKAGYKLHTDFAKWKGTSYTLLMTKGLKCFLKPNNTEAFLLNLYQTVQKTEANPLNFINNGYLDKLPDDIVKSYIT